MGPYGHVSFVIFLKYYVLFKGIFREYFSPIIMKNKSINFLNNLVKMPYTVALLSSSLIFSVLISKFNISRTFISFWICKQTDLIKSWQLNTSSIISQFVNVWFDKPSFVSGLMYLSESSWIIFQYLYTIFLKSISPFYL